MISPSQPGVAGAGPAQHDNMPQAGHDEQFEHANKGEAISESDKQEGSPEETREEKSDYKKEEDEE